MYKIYYINYVAFISYILIYAHLLYFILKVVY